MAALLTPFAYPYRTSWTSLPIYSANEVIKRAQWLCPKIVKYSQGTGGKYGSWPRGTSMNDISFDCSSFVATITGYSQLYPGSAPATPQMTDSYSSGYGYKSVYRNPPSLPVDPRLFQKGDLLIYTKPGTDGGFSNGHTAFYMGNGQTIEMTGSGPLFGGNVGRMGWQQVLRNPKSGFYPVRAY